VDDPDGAYVGEKTITNPVAYAVKPGAGSKGEKGASWLGVQMQCFCLL